MHNITVRPAWREDVRPALALALRVFMLHSAPLYTRKAVRHFRKTLKEKEAIRGYESGKTPMFVARDGGKLIGMAAAGARRADKISLLYVDPAYHRRGVATALMDALIAAMGAPELTLGSSSHGVPFYLNYGFVPTDAEQHRHGAIWTPMAYTVPVTIRPAWPGDVRPALDFAQRIFEAYVLPGFGPPARERLGLHRDSEEQIQAYLEGRWAMFVAVAGERVVGMVCERDGCHIRKLYVDGAWRRRGIATGLMDAIIRHMGARRITLNSSRYALGFYLKYGFRPTDAEQNQDGFIYTPMVYDKGA
ncbi:MAG: GNAT family N-acetyltransferase [Firmicutes bacterium]|nr:GNAT family N-acetyltransferase [Bacillota bacterium]